MTQEEFDVYRRRLSSEYAAEHVRAGNWSAAEAEQRAEQETDDLLPSGVDTPAMALLVGETGNEAVGMVWVGIAPQQRVGWWIYDIEVVPEQRRRGHGSQYAQAPQSVTRRVRSPAPGRRLGGDNGGVTALCPRYRRSRTNELAISPRRQATCRTPVAVEHQTAVATAFR
jgi:hypothetical protein